MKTPLEGGALVARWRLVHGRSIRLAPQFAAIVPARVRNSLHLVRRLAEDAREGGLARVVRGLHIDAILPDMSA
jgi:hypothetical protein